MLKCGHLLLLNLSIAYFMRICVADEASREEEPQGGCKLTDTVAYGTYY